MTVRRPRAGAQRAIPLRTRVFWTLVHGLERESVMNTAPERIRAASNRRRRLIRLPGIGLIVGRPDRSVALTTAVACLADGVEVPLRIYRRRDARAGRPVVVNFHGGGWVSGDARQSEWWCAGIAAAADVVVVSVDYRLAPEHPYPTAAEDCYAATQWIFEHAGELDVDGIRLAVMGDSAGGNLAAVVAVMARDRGGPAIALQVLLYPAVHIDGNYPSEHENAHAPVLSKADIDFVWHLYVPDGVDPRQPYISPLFADHHGLAPALIQTAQHDPLRDQGPVYAAALQDAGVPVRLTNYVDAVHGFISLPNVTRGAHQALGEAVQEIRARLA